MVVERMARRQERVLRRAVDGAGAGELAHEVAAERHVLDPHDSDGVIEVVDQAIDGRTVGIDHERKRHQPEHPSREASA